MTAALIDQLRRLKFRISDQIILVVADNPFTVDVCPPGSKGIDRIYVNLCLEPTIEEDPEDYDNDDDATIT